MTEGCSEAGLREVSYILINFLGLLCFACRRSILSLACTLKKFLCIHENEIASARYATTECRHCSPSCCVSTWLSGPALQR